MFGALPSAGIVFAYLGFEQADQLAGEIKNPQQNLPRAIIVSILLGTAIYMPAAGRVHRRHAGQPATNGFAGHPSTNPVALGPFAAVASLAGSAGSRPSCGWTRSSRRSALA